ncbi:MAG: IPT/TIG domain-containing protein [Myxococcales bacterium]
MAPAPRADDRVVSAPSRPARCRSTSTCEAEPLRLQGVRPPRAAAQAVILLSGTGFCLSPGENLVKVGEQDAQVHEASATLLIAALPNVVPGPTSITVSCGGRTSEPLRFEVLVSTGATSLSRITPDSGRPDAIVSLTGGGFADSPANNFVSFAGRLAAPPERGTASSLIVKVPPSATPGPVRVTNAITGQVSNPQAFKVRYAPTVLSINPNFAPVGTEVSIRGARFSLVSEDNVVKFGGVRATTVRAVSSQELMATVPPGATSNTVWVEVSGVASNADTPFTVALRPAHGP